MRLAVPLSILTSAAVLSSKQSVANAVAHGGTTCAPQHATAPRSAPSHNNNPMDLLYNIMLHKPFVFDMKEFAQQSLQVFSAASADHLHDRQPHALPYQVSRSANGTTQLVVEVPGVRAADISIDLVDNRLVQIRGKRSFATSNQHEVHFDQIFQLDSEANPQSLRATLEAGVLTLTVAQKEPVVQKIEIQHVREHEQVSVASPSLPQEPTKSADEDKRVDANSSVEITRDGLVITEEEGHGIEEAVNGGKNPM